MKQYLPLLLLLLGISAMAQKTQRTSLGMAGSTVIVQDKYVSSSVGQQSVNGTAVGEKGTLRQGFQQPVIQLVALPNVISDLEITIYPNPVEAILFIHFEQEINTPIKLAMYNVLGQQVLTETRNPQKQTTLDISSFSSGNYILTVEVARHFFSTKIIKN